MPKWTFDRPAGDRFYQIVADFAGLRHYPEGKTAVQALENGSDLILRPDPENPHDPHAIAIYVPMGKDRVHCGYVPRQLAARFARLMGDKPLGRRAMGGLKATYDAADGRVRLAGWLVGKAWKSVREERKAQ